MFWLKEYFNFNQILVLQNLNIYISWKSAFSLFFLSKVPLQNNFCCKYLLIASTKYLVDIGSAAFTYFAYDFILFAKTSLIDDASQFLQPDLGEGLKGEKEVHKVAMFCTN